MIFTLVKGKWANFLGSSFLDLDLLTVITAYLFLAYGQTSAGAFAFGQGLLVDLFSGGLRGIFTLLYLCIFATISLGSRLVDLQHWRGKVCLVVLAMLLKKVLFMIGLFVFSMEGAFPDLFAWTTIVSVVVTGLTAPVLFSIFNRIRSLLA